MDQYATMVTIDDAIDIIGSEQKADRNGDAKQTKALHVETPQVDLHVVSLVVVVVRAYVEIRRR